jgi:hypothetical protein
MSRYLLALALVFTAVAPAVAGDIVGYVSGNAASIATYDRFPNGINSPTPNTSSSFVGAGLDLSGIGWLTNNPTFATSLLAGVPVADPNGPAVGRYIVGANHVGFGPSVTFAENTGVTHTYSVTSTLRLTTNGVPSDILIGRLASAPTADGIAALPLAELTATNAVGVKSYAYGQNANYGADRRQLGLATIGDVQTVSFGGGDSPTVDAIWQQDPNQPGSVLLVGGDSGGPLFTRGAHGETALIGAHMGVDAQQLLSASSFLPTPEYVLQINGFMLQDGLQVQVVPVPEPAGLLAFVVGAVAWRRWVGGTRGANVPGS